MKVIVNKNFITVRENNNKVIVSEKPNKIVVSNNTIIPRGVPLGGATNNVLVKNSNADYDTKWIELSGGSGVPGPEGPAGADGADGAPGVDGIDGKFTIYKYKTADQVLSTNVLEDLVNLEIPVLANHVYSFTYYLQTRCEGTGGIKYAFNFPAASTIRAILKGSTSGINVMAAQVLFNTAEPALAFNTVNSAGGWAEVTGTLITGANPGTLALRYRPAVDTETVTVYAQSFVCANELAL